MTTLTKTNSIDRAFDHMAVSDDMNRLAAEDVVYLTRTILLGGGGPTEVFRGRLRQALNGNWVFNASTGQNGVVGFDLGHPGRMSSWSSSESPTTGVQVFISHEAPRGCRSLPLL
jgi:hypothetical protein